MNNDRFKFRVFYHLEHRYIDDVPHLSIGADGRAYYMKFLATMGFSTPVYLDPQDFTIERCTGLRDRNGNLIYEGDIVEYRYGEGKNEGRCKYFVLWDELNNRIMKFSIEDYTWEQKQHPDAGRDEWLKNTYRTSIGHGGEQRREIVGNIHEVTK